MPYLVSHVWPGATKAQWEETTNAVLPPGASPKGQLYYAAAVVDAGVIVTGVFVFLNVIAYYPNLI